MPRIVLLVRLGLFASAALMLSGCDFINSEEAAKNGTAAPAAEESASGAGAAAASSLDPNLAAPQVGDIWAANLDHFSAAEFTFGNNDNGQDAYGLVKIVDVTDTQVTIITETGAKPEQQTAIDALNGDLATVQWDESERIPINRADFEALVSAQRILRTRRGGAATSTNSGDYSAGTTNGGSNSGDYNAGGGAAPAPTPGPTAPPPAPAPQSSGGK